MARLTPQQWIAIRRAWELDPRPGTGWLTVRGGGPWDVTTEAIRKRRIAEGWRKHRRDPAVEHHADGAAGAEGCEIGGFALPPLPNAGDPEAAAFGPPFGGAAGADEDAIRAQVLAQHRRDWQVVRRLLDAAVAAGPGRDDRRARNAAETLRLVHRGEASAYALDAAIDFEALGDAELEAPSKGKRVR